MAVSNLRQYSEAKESASAAIPPYVEFLLKFWGAWLSGIRMPDLGYPHETLESRASREKNGERYKEETAGRDVIPETKGIHTMADGIGLQIDRAIEGMTVVDWRLTAVIVHRYLYGEPAKIACKRIHTNEDMHDKILFQARWYMAAKLEHLKRYAE